VRVDRDLRAFLRSRSQVFSSLALPLMLLGILGVGISDGLEPSLVRDGDYVTFLVPGIIVMTALFSSTFSSASFYQDRDSGMLKVLLVSPNSPAAILFGKTLGAIVIGSAQALAVLAFAAAIPPIDLQWQYGVVPSLLLALLAIVALNVLLSGLAQVLASRIRTMQGFHLVMNLVLFPLLFFSGAFFPLDDLPGWLYALGVLAVSLLLLYEHSLVKPGDYSRLDAAFFSMNGIISILFFCFVLLERLF